MQLKMGANRWISKTEGRLKLKLKHYASEPLTLPYESDPVYDTLQMITISTVHGITPTQVKNPAMERALTLMAELSKYSFAEHVGCPLRGIYSAFAQGRCMIAWGFADTFRVSMVGGR